MQKFSKNHFFKMFFLNKNLFAEKKEKKKIAIPLPKPIEEGTI